jgi:hypothetical protein
MRTAEKMSHTQMLDVGIEYDFEPTKKNSEEIEKKNKMSVGHTFNHKAFFNSSVILLDFLV